MVDVHDHQLRALFHAGFTDDQAHALIELFEPLKVRKVVNPKKLKYYPRDYESAKHIYSLVLAKFPDTPHPNLGQWADDLRKMREIDKIPVEKIAAVFGWAHENEFWSANIRSPAKLRKQFSSLCAQMQREANNGPNKYI